MKVIDLFTNKVANIKISYGVERERDLENDKSKKNKKSKIKKTKMKKYKKVKK